MEVVVGLAKLFKDSLSPDAGVRNAATRELQSYRTKENFAQALLHLIISCTGDVAVQLQLCELHSQSAAAFFLGMARDWSGENDLHISESDRAQVRSEILNVTLGATPASRRLLVESIGQIADVDFPSQWPTLVKDLVAALRTPSEDQARLLTLLDICHAVFRKYRKQLDLSRVFDELVAVLEDLEGALLELFKTVDAALMAAIAKGETSKARELVGILGRLIDIFHDLTFFDLTDFLASTLPTFFDITLRWMLFLPADRNSAIVFELPYTSASPTEPSYIPDPDAEAGPFDSVKSKAIALAALFLDKHDEEFAPFLEPFARAVWSTLSNVTPSFRDDPLAAQAFHFLCSVAKSPTANSSLGTAEVQTDLLDKFIVPAVTARESDIEAFESDPAEYLKRDIESSGADIRRRAAYDLVRALSQYHDATITSVVSSYVERLLQNDSPLAKDVAMYLLSAVLTKSYTRRDGATRVSTLMPVTAFMEAHVFPELVSASAPTSVPQRIVKASALRFLTLFRTHLAPKYAVVDVIKTVSRWLDAECQVLGCYTSYTVENLLKLRPSVGAPLVMDAAAVAKISPELLPRLVTFVRTLQRDSLSSPIFLYPMRCLSALCRFSGTDIASSVFPLLSDLLAALIARPAINPPLVHYVFECFSQLIRNNVALIPQIEASILPTLLSITEHGLEEFIPYALQIIAQMILLSPVDPTPGSLSLLPMAVLPASYEQHRSFIPGLVKYLMVVCERAPQYIIDENKLPAVLGVFQFLLHRLQHSAEAFNLIFVVLEYFPTDRLRQLTVDLMKVIFTRLQRVIGLKSRSVPLFTRCVVVFLSLFTLIFGPDAVITTVNACDTTNPTLWAQVLPNVFQRYMPQVLSLSGTSMEKKWVVVAATRFLTECPAMLTPPYVHLWVPFFNATVALFSTASKEIAAPKAHVEDDDEVIGADKFTPLKGAAVLKKDPVAAVTDYKQFFQRQVLHLVHSGRPEVMMVLESLRASESMLSAEAKDLLQAPGSPTG